MISKKPEEELSLILNEKFENSELIEKLNILKFKYPNNWMIQFELANAYDLDSQEEEAIPLYEELLNTDINGEIRKKCLIQLGSSLRNVGRNKQSIEILTIASRDYPESSSVACFLALSLFSEGDHRVAAIYLLEHLISSSEGDTFQYKDALLNYLSDIS